MSRWPGRLITKTPVTPGGSAPNASAPGVWTLPEMAYWKKQGLWPDASADAYWGYVSFLLSTSSLSNANNNLFVDSSSAFNPVARNGNATQGTQTPYGTLWSNYFDGNGDYLSIPNNAAFSYGTGDFTVEAWVYKSGSGSMAVLDSFTSGSGGTFGFLVNDTQVVGYQTNVLAYTFTYTVPLNTWAHIAFVRTGGNLTCYVNGTSIGSQANSANFTSSNAIIVGRNAGSGGDQWLGYVSNLRIVKGTAVYTSAFTPPAAPLTAISGTSLLTCQSNRFRDASTNNFTITANGNTAVSPYSPFVLNSPGAVYNQNDISYWSGYFDGSGDYLTVPSSTAFAYGTSDFTWEMWIFPTAASWTTGNFYLMDHGANGGTLSYYQDVVRYYNPTTGTGSALYTGGGTIPSNQWSHVAVARSGGTTRLFVNGALRASASDSNNYGSAAVTIANYGGLGVEFPGYISNCRIVKGTAIYTSAFTPPTAPLTAISGTSLLTLQNAAFTDNSTNNFILTPNGNVTVTGNNPYQTGYYSNYFDGSGDYLTVGGGMPSGQGTAFTMEFWTYISTAKTNIFTAGSAGGSLEFYVQSNGQLVLDNTGVVGICSSSAGVLNAGTWAHIALTRTTGNLYTAYVNGTAVMSGTNNTSMTANTTIGWHRFAGANYLNGYISNFRVTNTLVYSGNFTPPTAPLTAISGTSLLTCQANRLIDNSANNFTITKNGDVAVSPFDPFLSAVSPTGASGSGYFDGNGDYLSTSNSILPTVGDFTAETWFYRTTSADGILMYLRGGTGSYAGLRFGVSSTGVYLLMTTSDGTWVVNSGVLGSAPVGTWNHIAVVRNGGTITMYLNGASIYSTTAIAAASALMTGSVSEIGRMIYGGGTSDFFPGYMSNLRVTTSAVYTSTFTPPTAPLAATANTTLLLNFTNGGIYDASMKSDAETGGNAQASTTQVKYGTTSAYFDGNGDYLLTAVNPVFTFGTGDFTVEAWVYLNAVTSTYTKGVVGTYAYTGATDRGWFLGVTSTGITQLFMGGSSGSGFAVNGATTLTTGRWYHLAATRSGTTVRVFVDGVVDGSGTSAYNEDYTGRGLKVGTLEADSLSPSLGNPGASINGYIDDVRITRGYARYTSNFTPPTTALPVY